MANDNTNRRSGTIFIKKDGTILELAGDWTYNLGGAKRTTKKGPAKRYGFKEETQDCWLEGEILDSSGLDVIADLLEVGNSTITLELANGKTVVFREAWWAADGDIGTAEANIQARFEAIEAEEI